MFITRQIIEDPERNMIGEIINPPMATHQKPASLNDLRGVSYISGADRTGKRATVLLARALMLFRSPLNFS